jgi:hypothetical protein
MTYGFKFNNVNGELVIDDSNVKPWYFTGSIAGTTNFFGQNYKNVDVTANAYDFNTFANNAPYQPSSYVSQPYYTGDTWKVYELRYIAPNISDCFFVYTLPRSNDSGVWYFTQDVGINQPGGSTAGAGPIHLLNNPKTDILPYPGTGEQYVSIFAIVPDRWFATATSAQALATIPKVYFFSNKEVSSNILSNGYGMQVFDSTAKCMYDSAKLHIQLKSYSFQDWQIPPPTGSAGPDYNGADIRSFSVNTSSPPSNTAFLIPTASQIYYRINNGLGYFDIYRSMVQRVDDGTDKGTTSTIRTRTIKVTSQATQTLGFGDTIPGLASGTLWNYGSNSYQGFLSQQYKISVLAIDTGPLDRGYTGSAFPATFNLTVNKTTVSESNTVTSSNEVVFTLTTARIEDNSQIPYTITGTNITVNDISQVRRSGANYGTTLPSSEEIVYPWSLTGYFRIINNIGTITINIAEDYIAEGTETLTLALNNGLASATVSLTEDVAYSLSFISTPDSTDNNNIAEFNETTNGNPTAVSFQLKTKNIAANTQIPWNFSYIGSATTADFIQETSGTFTIAARTEANAQADNGFNGIASAALVLKKDLTTEGKETARIALTNAPSTYLNFNIIDNSTTPIPVFNIYNPSSQTSGVVYLDEGTEYVWIITATNLPAGTIVYPRINVLSAGFADLNLSPWYTSGSYNGVALDSGGLAVFKMTPVADVLLEGTEIFQVSLDYPLGTRVHNYPNTVYINDTSRPAEVYSISRNIDYTPEGQTLRITFTSSLDYAHPVFWEWEGVNLGPTAGPLSLADISSMRYFDPETNISGGPQYTNITKSSTGSFSFPTSGLKSSNLQFALEFIISNDGVTEPTEYGQIYLRPSGSTGTIYTSLGFFVQDPASYSFTSSATNVNEGGGFTLTFNTNQPGSFGYTITGVSSADIGGASLTGTIQNGSSLGYNVTADATTEGTEYFNIALNNGAVSTTVSINDTSLTPAPTYSFTSSATNVNESGNFTITFNTNQPGFFGYTISGVTSADIGGASLTGSVQNGSSLNYNVTADATTEGTEYFQITMNNGLAGAYVSINDTSTTPLSYNESVIIESDAWGDYIVPLNGYMTITIGPGAPNTGFTFQITNEWDAQPTSFTGTAALGASGYFYNYITGATAQGSQTIGDKRLWVKFNYDNNIRSARFKVVYDAGTTSGGQYCGSGYTLYQSYNNGRGGTYAQVVQNNSPTCGYVAPPAAGTIISQGCVAYGSAPYTYRVTKADGSGGTYNEDTNNSPSCGYVAPPAAGTLLSEYCVGYTRYGQYANGSGGSYHQVIQSNAPSCGYTPPGAVAPLVTSVTMTSGIYEPGETVDAIINFSGAITADTYVNMRLTAGAYGSFYITSSTGAVAPPGGSGTGGEYLELTVGTTSAYYTGPTNPGQLNILNATLSARTMTGTATGSQRQAYITTPTFKIST